MTHLCLAYFVDSWRYFPYKTKCLYKLSNRHIVTIDAAGMYAKFNIAYAIRTLHYTLVQNAPTTQHSQRSVYYWIAHEMKHNVFTFDNCFSLQKNGVAMRKILDVYMIQFTTTSTTKRLYYWWNSHSSNFIVVLSMKPLVIIDNTQQVVFESLIETTNDCRPEDKRLEWKPEMQGKKVLHFLDLWRIKKDCLTNLTFQNPVNLYLYQCPFSTQSPLILYNFS